MVLGMAIVMKALEDITDEASIFLDILPKDWQKTIKPYWDYYKKNSIVLVLRKDKKILAGGIVFKRVTPDTILYRNEGNKLLEEGFYYLGFIWVPLKHRGKGYGSDWMTLLKLKYPDQKFWLTTEESGLTSFYENNNFEYVSSKTKNGETEYLFTYTPFKSPTL